MFTEALFIACDLDFYKVQYQVSNKESTFIKAVGPCAPPPPHSPRPVYLRAETDGQPVVFITRRRLLCTLKKYHTLQPRRRRGARAQRGVADELDARVGNDALGLTAGGGRGLGHKGDARPVEPHRGA